MGGAEQCTVIGRWGKEQRITDWRNQNMQEHNRILQFFPDELCTALKNYLAEKAKNAEADCAERNDLAQMY